MQDLCTHDYRFEFESGLLLRSTWQPAGVAVYAHECLVLECVLDATAGTLSRGKLQLGSAVQTADVQHLALQVALHAIFATQSTLQTIQLELGPYSSMLPVLLRQGLVVAASGGAAQVHRECVLQQPSLWLQGQSSAGYPLRYVLSQGKRHPLRPPVPGGTVYRRYIPWLGQWLSLRTLDAIGDLAAFHTWMNNPRVAKFWEEQGDLEKHQAFMVNALADPHVHSLVGCLDDKPFGYFEVYWAKEDRIAPFYPVGDYDRGIHMLVGEDWARGPQHIAAWLPSLAHYVMLDDPRTHAVVCEPRVDNERMIGYLQQYGFAYLRQFDFPHKRAALLVLEREVHAQGGWLGLPTERPWIRRTREVIANN